MIVEGDRWRKICRIAFFVACFRGHDLCDVVRDPAALPDVHALGLDHGRLRRRRPGRGRRAEGGRLGGAAVPVLPGAGLQDAGEAVFFSLNYIMSEYS